MPTPQRCCFKPTAAEASSQLCHWQQELGLSAPSGAQEKGQCSPGAAVGFHRQGSCSLTRDPIQPTVVGDLFGCHGLMSHALQQTHGYPFLTLLSRMLLHLPALIDALIHPQHLSDICFAAGVYFLPHLRQKTYASLGMFCPRFLLLAARQKPSVETCLEQLGSRSVASRAVIVRSTLFPTVGGISGYSWFQRQKAAVYLVDRYRVRGTVTTTLKLIQ